MKVFHVVGRVFMAIVLMMVFTVSAMAEKPVAKRIFIFGDSMTGWMAERLEAYGEKNGFEVATLIWDGATMKKYANNSEKLRSYITKFNADAVIICLGMNEMATPNPEGQLGASLTKIKGVIGNLPYLWVGPCSWPGKPQWGPGLDKWLKSTLGPEHFFSSLSLNLPRQSKTNPHPTRQGINTWTDSVIDFIESGKGAFRLPAYANPAKEFARPKNYVYKKMNAPL